MEASELMIGDWVKYGKEYFQVDGYFRITNTLFLKYNGHKAYYQDGCVVAEDSEPIPLTAEILEKNGFMQVEDGVQEYNFPEGIWQNDSLLCGLGYNHRGMFYTFSSDPEEDGLINQIYGIFYVHQLQHALRLCGLNDLADNFKVC